LSKRLLDNVEDGLIEAFSCIEESQSSIPATKECRDTSVTLALQAGADPAWVAAQLGHSLAVMMRDYANWIPGGDMRRNLAAVNTAISSDSALNPHQHSKKNKKAL
jgi:predicted HD phosphohydrolase